MDINEIRKIVIDNFGGLKNATDDQIMTLYRSLSEKRKSELLGKKTPIAETTKKTGKTKVKEINNNAHIDGHKSDV